MADNGGGGDLISIPPCSRFLTHLTPMISYDHRKEIAWLAFKKVSGCDLVKKMFKKKPLKLKLKVS